MHEGKPKNDSRPLADFPGTAEEARAQGETFYFDWKQCRNGHWSVRYAAVSADSQCLQCKREREQRHKERYTQRRSENRRKRKARLRAKESEGNAP